ncbi:breast cancer type 1 susceptibility protein homolog isoform X2 [Mercenaria mercenaria]|uniref:breast cancer type 1 susceptibility protein homolog isoform X2 n=1 Tax=Mercenaria mercenaria TaxID=6596 RepID=UPI00234E741A|nr:breast cancer type 1 susceptibility protein homolog isoform X2 [Mercenaria mercenaria]
MLEENEESLDFGSLSECVVVSVDEDSESVSKAKRQRVNRLRRSPKNKEKVLNDKSKDDTHSTDSLAKDIPENKEKVLSDKIKDNTHSIDRLSKDNESEVSGSIEIIPDTMAENDTAVNPLEDNDGNKIEKDLANIEEINIIRNENNKKKTKKLKILNTCSINQSSSQVIDLSSSSESVSGLENSGNCEKKSERSPAEKSSKRGKGESQARKLCNSSETVDVIGETDMTNTGISGSEKKENFENLKIKENCKMVTNKFKDPNCLRSPKERKKRKSGQSEKDDDSQNDIVRIRHLSGMLVSPQESLVLSGMKDSVEDIFQIDSEMPSVDLSPVEGTLGLEPNSPSLDLGTLDAPDSIVNYNSTKKRKGLDQSELTLHETEENLIYKNGVKTVNEKEQSDSINLSPENDIDLVKSKNEISLDQHSDSSPEEKRRRSNVKAVRGFSRKKRQSDIGQSQMSGSSSGNSVISRTPQALTSVKCKSPVAKFLSPKTAKSVQSKIFETGKQSEQNDTSHETNETDEISLGKKLKLKLVENSQVKQKQTDTPVKALKETNVSKYSPSLVKQKKEHEEKKEATFEPEVVELKHYDDEEDECVLSPNDLPDLDDENVAVNPDEEKVAVTVNPDFEITNDEQVRDKLSGRSKISPKLLLNSPDKVKNIVLKASSQNLSDRIENEYRTTIPETMSFDDDDDDEKCNHVKCDKTPTGPKTTENKQVNHVTEKVTSTGDDENSIDSSSSPDFTLDSSSDDEHPEEQALTEISKFDKIVEHSIDTGKSNVLQNVDRNESKNAKFSYEKTRKKRRHKGIEKESFVKTRTPEHGDIKDQDDHESSVKGIAPVNSEDMYSTRLDSSPASCEEVNIDSEPVIVESDLDGDESENDNDRGVGDKGGDFGTANEIMELDNEGADDDDSDESDAVVRRKGVKRAILSDSSSEDEEGSRYMNMTSSSAFSSQSENLTTQERYSLEKEVERMAREMEAMKEQLRRSKEWNQSKQSDKKHSPNPVTVDDSDEDMIEANDSDNAAEDEDMFMSPPAITPGDLQMDDEETLDPAVVQDEENDVTDKGETVEQVDESLALPLESLTVPESDPSQLSRPGPVQGSDPSQSSHPKPVPESDPSQLSRPVLADLDTNISQSAAPNNKKPVGIVVTGLNVQQIQQTKKLAALTNAKFFTKFNDLVTHVIVKPADEDETICDRTLKFFQGIAKKCWIVNFFWVVDSRQVGHLLPEGPYEIQGDTANNEAHYGPRRSRLSGDKKLFKKFQFSLIGDNTFLSKDSMADLVETCGGDVCNMAHLGQGSRIPLVISCTDLDDEEEDLQFIVKHANDIYKGLGVVTVTREWILDSLTLYRVQPLQDYVVTDVPNLKLPRI